MKKYLLLLLFLLPLAHVDAAFGYYRSYVVNSSQVTGTQSSFPMLINDTQTTFKTTGNGGRVTNANGYDLGIYSSSDCSTGKLNWEVEEYNGTVGRWIAFVNVSSLATGSTVYVCAGDASITTDQSNPTAVWNTNFKSVYHMADNAANTTTKDSTSNALNATAPANTNTLYTTAGAIDGAHQYTGNNADTNDTTLDLTSFTIEMYWNYTTQNFLYSGPLSYRPAGKSGFQFVNDGTGGSSDFEPHLVIWNGTSEASNWWTGSGGYHLAMPWNTMHHFVWTFDGSTVLLYVDGVSKSVTTVGADSGYGSPGTGLQIGKAYTIQTGIMDEVRISNSVRSANWVTAEYNNFATSTFFTVSAENPVSSGAAFISRLIIWGQIIINNGLQLIIN